VKLSAWAAQEGLHYQTAWRLWKTGKLPVPARQLATGTVLVDAPAQPAGRGVALYARVSSSDQKKDLEGQLGRLAVYAAANGLNVIATAAEVGSGLNGHRRGLMGLLRNPKVGVIVVEHRDRLMRFGAEYVEAALAGSGAVFPGDISWNFNKFLVGRDGKVVARFDSGTEPDSAACVKAIEAALAAK
jgi:predicted site-specific integrase-resolvase